LLGIPSRNLYTNVIMLQRNMFLFRQNFYLNVHKFLNLVKINVTFCIPFIHVGRDGEVKSYLNLIPTIFNNGTSWFHLFCFLIIWLCPVWQSQSPQISAFQVLLEPKKVLPGVDADSGSFLRTPSVASARSSPATLAARRTVSFAVTGKPSVK